MNVMGGWTVLADKPDGKGFIGEGFDTQADALARAKELEQAGFTNVKVQKSELRPHA